MFRDCGRYISNASMQAYGIVISTRAKKVIPFFKNRITLYHLLLIVNHFIVFR